MYHDAIREILLKEWDPIGVGLEPEAQDEYDAYVGQIHGLICRREPTRKIFEFLWRVETELVGLCGNRSRTAVTAERLFRLPELLAGKQDNG
jgi:hypothetical protein